jgi:catechol 2,3-dioxygenase-like lactoylglutathione lyase family enzyme
MSAYVTIGANDSETSNRFYDAVLGTIGWSSHVEFPGWRAYSEGGRGDGFTIWIARPFDGGDASAGNGSMTGLPAASREQVDDFHAAALANGGSDEGAPGLRAHYGPNWYAAYVRDPVGNKLGVICRSDN